MPFGRDPAGVVRAVIDDEAAPAFLRGVIDVAVRVVPTFRPRRRIWSAVPIVAPSHQVKIFFQNPIAAA
jgi:hypothetical protein